MSLNATPSANRVHIGFFGCRNAGKSSVVNAVTGQELCIVSDTKGTTTDPVQKAMELLPLGPVVIIDTPGYDDEGDLGMLRVRRTKQVLNKTDVAVLVVDAGVGLRSFDTELLALFEAKKIPYCLVYNKCDLAFSGDFAKEEDSVSISAKTGEGIDKLMELIDKKLDKGTRRVTLHLPYDKTGLLDSIYREGKVESVEYSATVDVVAICTPRLLGQLKDYIEGWVEEKEEWEM